MWKDAAEQLMGGRGKANCRFWLDCGRLWWWEGLSAGAWLGGQLLVNCGADGCSCLCKGGGPAGWMEPQCSAGVEAGVRAGLLLSQALRRENRKQPSVTSNASSTLLILKDSDGTCSCKGTCQPEAFCRETGLQMDSALASLC